MLNAGLHLCLGLVCGFRLTFPSFAVVMTVSLAALACRLYDETGPLDMLRVLALSAVLLQVSYVGGLVVRAYAEAVRPRFSRRASTPGSLPRKAR